MSKEFGDKFPELEFDAEFYEFDKYQTRGEKRRMVEGVVFDLFRVLLLELIETAKNNSKEHLIKDMERKLAIAQQGLKDGGWIK